MLDGPESWQAERGRLNHDWLKNRLLPVLAALVSCSERGWEDDVVARNLVEVELPGWPHRIARLRQLIEAFEDVMSPRWFFRSAAFAFHVMQTPAPIEAVQACWFARTGAAGLLEQCRQSLDLAEEAMTALRSRVASVSPSSLWGARPEVELAYERILELSQALSRLPNRIELV